METTSIQLALLVLETRSFTEAGEKMGFTQSAVSKKIKKLEEELGVRLFERKETAEVKPTTKGKALFPLLEKIGQLEKQLLLEAGARTPILKIGIPNGLEKDLVLDFFHLLRKKGYQPQLVVEESELIQYRVEENQYDAGILGYQPESKRFLSKKITEETIVLAGLPKYTISTFSEIRKLPFVLHQKGSGLRTFLEKLLLQRGIRLADLSIFLEFGFNDFSQRICQMGEAVAFLPKKWVVPPLQILWEDQSDYFNRGFWIIAKEPKIIDLF